MDIRCSLGEFLLDVSYLRSDAILLLSENVGFNCSQDLDDKFVADSDQSLVELVRLDQEHGHPDFEWASVLDLLDGVLELLDLILEVLSLVGSFL